MAFNYAARVQLQNAILNALGIADRQVESVVLHISVHEPFRAVVTFVEEYEQALAEVVATYRFNNVEEAE